LYEDVLDGYSFLFPADWVQVKVRARHAACASALLRRACGSLSTHAAAQTAGADVFFRGPLKVEENLFVEARPRCAAHRSPRARCSTRGVRPKA
jgi:hypothetical protein